MNKVFFEEINTGYYFNKISEKKKNVSCFLIKHPHYGYILFDTAFNAEIFEKYNNLPFLLYKTIYEFNFPQERNLINQLKQKGISPCDVKYIIISHFHADNICSLKEFPNAKFICSKKAFTSKNITFIKYFIKNLLPDDFKSRVMFLEDFAKRINVNHFNTSFDIFYDNSLYAVILEGHTDGQTGLIFENDYSKIFLVADSVSKSEEYKRNQYLKSKAFSYFENVSKYKETLGRIHRFYLSFKDLQIFSTHHDY